MDFWDGLLAGPSTNWFGIQYVSYGKFAVENDAWPDRTTPLFVWRSKVPSYPTQIETKAQINPIPPSPAASNVDHLKLFSKSDRSTNATGLCRPNGLRCVRRCGLNCPTIVRIRFLSDRTGCVQPIHAARPRCLRASSRSCAICKFNQN
jgi:hypothetical protein